MYAHLDFIMRVWYTMGEQVLTFYLAKLVLVSVQGKEGKIMQFLFEENQKEETKSTPVWVYALGALGTLGALGAVAYYFLPF